MAAPNSQLRSVKSEKNLPEIQMGKYSFYKSAMINQYLMEQRKMNMDNELKEQLQKSQDTVQRRKLRKGKS